jgi:hypothetical protein
MEKITPVRKAGEPRSPFDKPVHDAHYASLRQMLEAAGQLSHLRSMAVSRPRPG